MRWVLTKVVQTVRGYYPLYSTSSWPDSVEVLTGEHHYYTMPKRHFDKRLISGHLLRKTCYKTQPSIRPLFTALYKKEKSVLKTKTEIISSRSERTAEHWIQSLALILVAIDSWNSGFHQQKYRLSSYELCWHSGGTIQDKRLLPCSEGTTSQEVFIK